jgi:hypothetical protein
MNEAAPNILPVIAGLKPPEWLALVGASLPMLQTRIMREAPLTPEERRFLGLPGE